MGKSLHICYLAEGTPLVGGVKVIFEQAEALQERGHQVTVITKGERPTWYDVRVPFKQVREFSPSVIPDCDFLIGTFWLTVPPAVQSGKGRPVHLCQGYEGNYPDYAALHGEIEAVYRLPTLTLTVHEPLTQLIWKRFAKKAHTVGQGINHTIFFPGAPRQRREPYRVALVGPYEDGCKGVHEGLLALKALKHELPLQVVRASPLGCSQAEHELGVVDEYHLMVPPQQMGNFYRSCDAFLGPSRAREGFGLPALEALACGVPVAVSDIPSFAGFAETADWGLFFAESDVQGMQNAVQRLLTDSTLRDHLRLRGLEVSRLYSFARVAERIEQVFAAASI